ncbi:Methyl-accepting chemotaxis protein, partial [hydrothermal vent metagenome]
PPALPGPGGTALASGPTWEGWVEPPAYTGLPSLYLNDIDAQITVPEGSRVTLRLYGEVGALSVIESVSGPVRDVAATTKPEQNFTIAQDGELSIDGPGGRKWAVMAIRDTAPLVALLEDGARTTFDGQMSQPFRAMDDYGVIGGTATFTLDLAQVERRFGLMIEPEARAPIVLELPMPISGSREDFTEMLIENLSEHAWAHMPVMLTLEVLDERGQTGTSAPLKLNLPARRFFDPLAASLIEMRRDLLWSKANGQRVVQVLRAISYKPEPGLFRKDVYYLKLRVILKRLERLVQYDSLRDKTRDEIAVALWELAEQLEDGDIEDALERMRMAQERLNQAMKNGASEDEIAELMQELRDATKDYLRQKTQQAQRENNVDQPDQTPQNTMELSQQDLQDMMDRIQELMEQGRFAEAQQALEEFQEMMENLRVTEGGNGQSEGQQSMEGLADTLRQQQGLSDQAFRDLQEQFNPNSGSGQSQENKGKNGSQGQGQSHDGQGQGTQGDEGQNGLPQPGGKGSLADRQEALRKELERQRGSLPGAGTQSGDAARDALDRAGRAMDGAEDALRQDDLAEAIDRQSEAMEALREGMRNLGDAMAEQQNPGGQGQARGQSGGQQSDPLGRSPGNGRRAGTEQNLLQGEDVYRRARDLLDEIQRRSGESDRPEIELEYLQRLLDRF